MNERTLTTRLLTAHVKKRHFDSKKSPTSDVIQPIALKKRYWSLPVLPRIRLHLFPFT